MKILIGTPVHQCKDYGMERWLKSVSKLDYPFDLLMVDNSPDSSYLERVHEYCKKYGLINYKLVHIDVGMNTTIDERLASSREIIRQEILKGKYDAWFSIECDVIAPSDALTKLVDLIGDYRMISHIYPARDDPNEINAELGISLIKRQVLVKLGFINEYGYVDPLLPNCRYGNDVWFIRRIDRSNKEKRMVVAGIIKPIYHLNQ